MRVYVLTHHSGIDSRGVLGVYATPEAAQLAALDDAHRQRAKFRTDGAETLEWQETRYGVAAIGRRFSYVVDAQPVVTETPAVRGVREHEVAYFTELVREGHQDIDVFSDDDQAAIRSALAAA